MEENSLAGAPFPVLVSLAIAGASILGALALQVGSNVLSDEISMRWRLRRRRMLEVQRQTYSLRLRARRRRVRRLNVRRAAGAGPLKGMPPAEPTFNGDTMEAQLAHAEALAERELHRLIDLCAPEFEGRVFAFPFGETQLDAGVRRAKVVAALESRAAALLRRGRGRCRA